jgi:hypothetical protein
MHRIFFSSSCSTLWSLFTFWSTELISQFLGHFTDGRTPWTGEQPVARNLPIQRTTQTEKNAHTPNIHALNGIRTHDPGFRASEYSTCLRLRAYCDRRTACTLA